jgi:hypothetical protein
MVFIYHASREAGMRKMRSDQPARYTVYGRPISRDAKAQWAIKWRSTRRSFLMGDVNTGFVRLFRTRREARAYAEQQFGYIRQRPDLRAEPHGWRMPQVVRVRVTVKEV